MRNYSITNNPFEQLAYLTRQADRSVVFNLGFTSCFEKHTYIQTEEEKSIFCVDNVNMSCTAEDMISFITAVPIEVVSCFEVKPRRRQNDSASSVNRKAFRIGIYSDVDRFLNADMWPDSITISEWFFKPPSADTDNSRQQQQQQQKRINVGGATGYSTQSASTSVAAASCSATAAQTTDGPPVSEDHDETILAAYDEVTMDTAVANDGE